MTFFYYTAALSETEILCTDLSHMLSPTNIQCIQCSETDLVMMTGRYVEIILLNTV